MFEHHYDNMIIKNYTFRDINNYLKIKIETLDNYMNLNNINKISFLKIDTEDHKYEILKGLKKNSICRYDNV